MRCSKKALFGGTLLAAGLMAPAASAQSFTFQQSYARTGAVNYVDFTFDFDYFFGPGQFAISSYSAAYGDGYFGIGFGSISASANQIQAYGYAYNGGGYGQSIYSYFTVDQNLNAQVDWNWAGGGSYLAIDDVSNNVNLFFDAGTGSGSTSVPLTAGTQYRVSGYALSFAGTSHWTVTVPTPGAAGLLGIAGLVATRRRR